MMNWTKSLIATLLLVGGIVAPVSAQVIAQVQPGRANASLTTSTCTGTSLSQTGCVGINLGGYGSISVQISGTWTGVLSFETTVDGTNWVAVNLAPSNGSTSVTTASANGVWYGTAMGAQFRVRFSTPTSGTAVVYISTTLSAALRSSGGVDAGSLTGTTLAANIVNSSLTSVGTLTNLTTPTVMGGSGTTSTLTLQPTSGNSTTGADIIFKGGNNGATEFGRWRFSDLRLVANTGIITGFDNATRTWLTGLDGSTGTLTISDDNSLNAVVIASNAFSRALRLNSNTSIVQFSGGSASFPALKRNGAVLETRLADDSAYGSMKMDKLTLASTSGDGTSILSLSSASSGPVTVSVTSGPRFLFDRGGSWSNNALDAVANIQFNGTVASVGHLRDSNNTGGYYFRNAVNNADILGINVDSSNVVNIGDTNASTILFRSAATQLRTTQSTQPTCSSNCGTSPSVVGTDTFMTVTMGATGVPASGWVITFNGTWAAAPSCVAQMAKTGMAVGKLVLTAVTTTTTLTAVTNGVAPANGDVYHIHCGGIQ